MLKVDCSPKFGVWFPFVGVRHKEPYDVLLIDGTMLKSIYPNGVEWSPAINLDAVNRDDFFNHPLVKDKSLHDDKIVALRLLTDAEISYRNIVHSTGGMRVARLMNHRAYDAKVTIFDDSELLKDNQVRDFINRVESIAVEHKDTDSLREAIGKEIKLTIDRFRTK